MCSMHFVHFFAVVCKTTTWNNNISGFDNNVSSRQWIFFIMYFYSKTVSSKQVSGYSPVIVQGEQNGIIIILLIAQNDILKWGFHCHCHCSFLSSLIIVSKLQSLCQSVVAQLVEPYISLLEWSAAEAILFISGCSKVNCTWLITSELRFDSPVARVRFPDPASYVG